VEEVSVVIGKGREIARRAQQWRAVIVPCNRGCKGRGRQERTGETPPDETTIKV